ncbi:hypothetical protein [Bacillus rubiinfantis]|uniref:hypothetical protein n=1 Tax=Bacillus rubiinfantis TaxID=1499680 RepID=UPI0005A8B14E|nr:hypothetical protein [Bacillus rubiinfantis]
MNLLLDMKTIVLTLVVGHLFTILLISSYWRNHSRDSTLNTFFLAKCIQGAAWFLLALRNGISDIFTISVANSLLFIGSALEAIALLKLIDSFQSKTKKFNIGLIIAYLVGFHLLLYFYNYEPARIAFASFSTAVLCFLPAYRLMIGKHSTLLTKIMGILYFLVTISFFARGIAAITSNEEMSLFTPGFIQTISFLSLFFSNDSWKHRIYPNTERKGGQGTPSYGVL